MSNYPYIFIYPVVSNASCTRQNGSRQNDFARPGFGRQPDCVLAGTGRAGGQAGNSNGV